jgi:hypothetical protein
LKGEANGAIFQPLSTGITFALTEKVPADKTLADHCRPWVAVRVPVMVASSSGTFR